MREIKFRAWDGQRLFDYLSVSSYGVSYFEYIESPKNLEIMQYTGLKDKNRKDIYEGDIVKFTNPIDEIYEQIGICKFEQDECNFVLQYKGLWNDHYALHTIYLISNKTYECSYEVIGNIYDNPELVLVD